jgi:hypothetical protein
MTTFKNFIKDLALDTIDWYPSIFRILWNCMIAFYVGNFVFIVMEYVINKYSLVDNSNLAKNLTFVFVLMILISKSFRIYRKL